MKAAMTPVLLTLLPGQRIVQTRYAPGEILRVLSVDDSGVSLEREDGRKFCVEITVLRAHDYEIKEEETKQERAK